MSLRPALEKLLAEHVAALAANPAFAALESGAASRVDYDRFLSSVYRTHARSPRFLAFLYALAPPGDASESLRHNLLEEMGLEAGATSHPEMLRRVLEEAGLGDRLAALDDQAADDLRQIVREPVLYATLAEVGLAVLCEVVAFEYMLSRLSSRIGRALVAHRGLSEAAVAWFSHHSEVDIGHAEQGLASLEAYVAWYRLPAEEAMTICETALREDVFTRRYFAAAGEGRRGGA